MNHRYYACCQRQATLSISKHGPFCDASVTNIQYFRTVQEETLMSNTKSCCAVHESQKCVSFLYEFLTFFNIRHFNGYILFLSLR